jgi:hypothetical protein
MQVGFEGRFQAREAAFFFGASRAARDWEFFELDVSTEGSSIRHRRHADVVNRFGGNCLGCHAADCADCPAGGRTAGIQVPHGTACAEALIDFGTSGIDIRRRQRLQLPVGLWPDRRDGGRITQLRTGCAKNCRRLPPAMQVSTSLTGGSQND